MNEEITSWDPWVYLCTERFGRRPLILGEAPSPRAPTASWSVDAKSTRNLATIIFGSATETGRLESSFEMRNVFKTHPGRSRDGFSVFDSDSATINLQEEDDAGLFDDRVTFFLGLRVAAGLCRTESYEPALSKGNRFAASDGWIDWLPVENHLNVFGLYLFVPHPQSYGLRHKPEDLLKLSALFRAALFLPPLDFQFKFRWGRPKSILIAGAADPRGSVVSSYTPSTHPELLR